MRYPRVRLRAQVTITTLDAGAYASTHPYIVDLIGTAVDSSRAVSDGVVSAQQPITQPAAGAAPPPLGSRFEPHQGG